MSCLTDAQVKALNDLVRTTPTLRSVFPYTVCSGSLTGGFGVILNNGLNCDEATVATYSTTSGILDTDATISSSSISIISILFTNEAAFPVVVRCADADNNAVLTLVVPPADSRTLTYSAPTTYSNGFKIYAPSENGTLVRYHVAYED